MGVGSRPIRWTSPGPQVAQQVHRIGRLSMRTLHRRNTKFRLEGEELGARSDIQDGFEQRRASERQSSGAGRPTATPCSYLAPVLAFMAVLGSWRTRACSRRIPRSQRS